MHLHKKIYFAVFILYCKTLLRWDTGSVLWVDLTCKEMLNNVIIDAIT